MFTDEVITLPPEKITTIVLNVPTGDFQTPNWPETYPVNIDIHWQISCPSDNYYVELNLGHTPFGIAGKMPDCTKDWVRLYDGSKDGTMLGQFCHLTIPPVVTSSTSQVLVEFHAGAQHGDTRKGFSASYKCVARTTEAPTTLPTTLPPTQCPPVTIPPLPQCGFHLNSNTGVISTPNWPDTYNVNERCEWIIQLPDCNKVVEITFTNFSVAGQLPDCTKDKVTISDGVDVQDKTFGPYCHLSLPPVIRTTSNVAHITFIAGPGHGVKRLGYSATFQAVDTTQ